MKRRGVQSRELTRFLVDPRKFFLSGNPQHVGRVRLVRAFHFRPRVWRSARCFPETRCLPDAVLGNEVRDILRLDSGDQAGIGERRIAAGERHAVDDDLFVGGRCRNDPTTRTHAERMHTAILNLGREPVTCGGQQIGTRLSFGNVILLAIDERLRVLNAETDRKRLVLHQNAFTRQELIDVPRRMARGENRRIAEKLSTIDGGDSADFFVRDQQVVHFRLKCTSPP